MQYFDVLQNQCLVQFLSSHFKSTFMLSFLLNFKKGAIQDEASRAGNVSFVDQAFQVAPLVSHRCYCYFYHVLWCFMVFYDVS